MIDENISDGEFVASHVDLVLQVGIQVLQQIKVTTHTNNNLNCAEFHSDGKIKHTREFNTSVRAAVMTKCNL